ncbi:hypothetical protein [Xanthobacter sp. ZOL 2024]
MRIFLALVTLLALTTGPSGMGPVRAAAIAGNQPAPADMRTQATAHLKFLYAMYFAIRGCTEAADEQSEPKFKPTVSLAEAQRILRAADVSARSVGIDVDQAWLEMSSIGQAAGEALKQKDENNFQKCHQSGMFFRTITSKLQMTIIQLKGSIPLIEKDF